MRKANLAPSNWPFLAPVRVPSGNRLPACRRETRSKALAANKLPGNSITRSDAIGTAFSAFPRYAPIITGCVPRALRDDGSSSYARFGPIADMKPGFEERYSRQVLFAGIGSEGQERLMAARVAIVGCGATGSALASLLARAGVGALRIIDRDYVEPSNLQRQALFDEQDAADSVPKAIAAARKIGSFNSQVTVEPCAEDLTSENVERLLAGAEVILDGTDNFETRFLLNDFSVKNSVPWIYLAAVGSYAATMNVIPGDTACLACIFAEPPSGIIETCETAGILNSAVNFAASIAATETLKLLTGNLQSVRRTLLSRDLWTNESAEIATGRTRADCAVCGQRSFVHLAGARRPHITLCGRNSVQIHEHNRPIDLGAVGERLKPHGNVRRNDFVLKFSKEPFELTLFPDGRAIVKGTTDIAVARGLYAKYVGN